MKKEININKRVEKLVHKLFENINQTIYSKINGVKNGYKIDMHKCYENGEDYIELHRINDDCNDILVYLNLTQECYSFKKYCCNNEIEIAVSKEFMKEIKKKLDKEIDFFQWGI